MAPAKPVAVAALQIYYGIAHLEEVVGQKKRLVQIAAGIVTDVEYQLLHALVAQGKRSLVTFLVSGAGEFSETDIAHAVV